MAERVLVIGATGQIGTELVQNLRAIYGQQNVFASDVKDLTTEQKQLFEPYIKLDALDKNGVHEAVKKNNITQVYLLAALLSATAEQKPAFAWELNMNSLFYVLDLAKEGLIKKMYWPSSIAVFGPTTPKENTPQYTIMEPSTVYGISKQTGERWCEWYNKKFGVDVRSIRYPGLIGYKSIPGGGTTDYAVHIFHEAIKNKQYTCFLSKDTMLPMMYMQDAIKGTINLMEAPTEQIKIRSAYNLAGISFTPAQLATEIQKHIPDFTIKYEPDQRQAIADSWPKSIDDSCARNHWAWKHEYGLEQIVADMIKNISQS